MTNGEAILKVIGTVISVIPLLLIILVSITGGKLTYTTKGVNGHYKEFKEYLQEKKEGE